MRQRAFLSGSVAMLAAPLAVEGQPTGRVYRIGLLFEGTLVADMTGRLASPSPPSLLARADRVIE